MGSVEVVRSPVPWSTLPAAKAWLLGYVRTDVPGYREISRGPGGASTMRLSVLASATYRFDAYFDAVDAAWQALGGDPLEWTTAGQVTGTGDVMTYTDRLGWLVGMVNESVSGVTDVGSFVPPAGIPLMGATWAEVTSEVERRQITDRHRRNQGFVWGTASVWRCVLTMHRWSLEALQTGWCLRGNVTVGGASKLSTPVGLTDPDGAITGYVLGVDGIEWLDQTQTHARVSMSLVTE